MQLNFSIIARAAPNLGNSLVGLEMIQKIVPAEEYSRIGDLFKAHLGKMMHGNQANPLASKEACLLAVGRFMKAWRILSPAFPYFMKEFERLEQQQHLPHAERVAAMKANHIRLGLGEKTDEEMDQLILAESVTKDLKHFCFEEFSKRKAAILEGTVSERIRIVLELFEVVLPKVQETFQPIALPIFEASIHASLLPLHQQEAVIAAARASFDTWFQNAFTVLLSVSGVVKKTLFSSTNAAASSSASLSVAENDAFKMVLANTFDVVSRVEKASKERAPASASASASASAQPPRPFAAREEAVNAALNTSDVGTILSQFEYTFTDALREVGGDVRKLPPDWVQSLSELRELELSSFDMTYEKWQALGEKCTFVNKIVLQGVTCNGSARFDAEAVRHFFGGRGFDVEVIGAPCMHVAPNIELFDMQTNLTDRTRINWFEELMSYHESMGLSKAALWNLYIALHNEEHTKHPENFDQAKSENEEHVVEALYAFISQLSSAVLRGPSGGGGGGGGGSSL